MTSNQTTVFLNDSEIDKKLISINSNIRVLMRKSLEKILNSTNLFIFTTANALDTVSDIIQKSSSQLKGVLIRPDIDKKYIPLIVESEINKEHQSKYLVYSHENEYLRILRAWQANAQEQLIAQAVVTENKLIVKDCSLKTWTIPFDHTPILSRIPVEERENFELDEDGSFLYWPSPDIHLDLEALRITVDLQLQQQREREKQEYNHFLGYAIAKVRKAHHLRQKDIKGLSEKEVRRIEKGHHPSLSQLRTLAAVHQLTLNDYLEEVAMIVDHLYTSLIPS